MSRTPVGEAVRQLAVEGLVEQVPRCGTIVRGFGRRDLIELFELREALECYAVALAAQRAGEVELAKLQALCDALQELVDRTPQPPEDLTPGELTARELTARELTARELTARELNPSDPSLRTLDAQGLKGFLSADLGFHAVILHLSANTRLQRVVAQTRTMLSLFRLRRQSYHRRSIERTLAEHLEILEAIRQKESQHASQRMSEHLAQSQQQALAQFDHQDTLGCTTAELPTLLPAELVEMLEYLDQADAH